MNTSTYGATNALIDIIASPGRALDEAKAHPRWLWWPLLINVVVAIAVFTWYFLWVDFPWLVDDVIRTSVPPGGDPAMAEAIRGFMSPTVQIASTAVGIVLVTLIIYTIQSTYLHLVNKAAGDPSLRFGQWFAFSAWTAFPSIFQSLAMLVVILMAENNQLSQADLSPLSFQSLFIHAEPGTSWFTWGSSLSLVTLWIMGLMVFGFARWTGSSLAKSALITLAPWVLIFGIWAAIIAA